MSTPQNIMAWRDNTSITFQLQQNIFTAVARCLCRRLASHMCDRLKTLTCRSFFSSTGAYTSRQQFIEKYSPQHREYGSSAAQTLSTQQAECLTVCSNSCTKHRLKTGLGAQSKTTMQNIKLHNILSDWDYQLLPAISAPPQQRCLGNA